MSHKITTTESEAIRALWARLMAAYPRAFATPAVPLKIGIARDIRDAHADIEQSVLTHLMRRWCGRPSYQKALVKGGPRVDLTGLPAGEVSPEQMLHAAEVLKAMRKKKAKSQAQAVSEPRAAPTPAWIPPHLCARPCARYSP
jgi:sRNA-binding protein